MYDPINYNIRFRIGYTPSGIEESGRPVIEGYEVYPNPSLGNVVIKYGLNQSSDISLSLYDITGRLLKNIYSGIQEQGSHEFTLSKEDELADGIYFICLETGNNKVTKKLVIVR